MRGALRITRFGSALPPPTHPAPSLGREQPLDALLPALRRSGLLRLKLRPRYPIFEGYRRLKSLRRGEPARPPGRHRETLSPDARRESKLGCSARPADQGKVGVSLESGELPRRSFLVGEPIRPA